MAERGSSKWFSVQAEDRFCRAYQMEPSPSSGAAVTRKGDGKQKTGTRMVGQDLLGESKHTGTFTKPAKSASIRLADFEKLADEAYSENREPLMHLSIYAPDSILANTDGYVDIVARLMSDDVRRETL